MSDTKFDVFISYRRDGGETLGRLIFELLKDDYRVFFDHESLSCGRFDKKIIDIIEGAQYILVLLTKGCLARCSDPEDWFMREIDAAIKSVAADENKEGPKREIILLLDNGFTMPTLDELSRLPKAIDTLRNYNGYEISIAYIDSAIEKLRANFKIPSKGRREFYDDIAGWRKIAARIGEGDFNDTVPYDVRSEIMQNAVRSCLGEQNASIVNTMIDKNFREVQNVRPRYRYEITLAESFPFSTVDISEDKYYSLQEIMDYTKLFLSGGIDESFWLSFSTNLDSLDEELKAESFFFSENLLIDREDMRRIAALSDEDIRDFYLSDMKVKISINGRSLTPAEIKVSEGGIFARYELESRIEREVTVKIRFRIPQKKTNGYFFASINEPAYSPFISFSYPEDEMDVTMIPFLSRAITAKDTKIFDGVRELSIEKEWVLPVSGAIFIIENIEKSKELG